MTVSSDSLVKTVSKDDIICYEERVKPIRAEHPFLGLVEA